MDVANRRRAAIEIAREAGGMLLDYGATGVVPDRKGRIDLVSDADRETERLIRDRIGAAFPDDLVVGEEGNPKMAEAHVGGKSRWYVDPLDGTTNFLHGSDRWGVSLGWCGPDDVVGVGVVFVPRRNEMFAASTASGAELNGKKIEVSRAGRLVDAVVGTGFPYVFEGPTNFAEFEAVTRRALSIRCQGAAALDLCDVACGRLDGFWEQGLARWDTAAGSVIAMEAGAVVTDMSGRTRNGPLTDIVAAGSKLHPRLVSAMNGLRCT